VAESRASVAPEAEVKTDCRLSVEIVEDLETLIKVLEACTIEDLLTEDNRQ